MSNFWSGPSFTSIPYVCEQRRLWLGCAVSSEPSLFTYAISTIISWHHGNISVRKWPHHSCTYSAGEEKSPYFLFHGETALGKILKFQGETANSSEKFQGEISEFLRENMELYRQNLKISGRNTGISWRKYWISWRKYWISWRNLEKFSTISPSFSQKKRQLIMEKNKKWGFFFTCTVYSKKQEYWGMVKINNACNYGFQ